MNTHRACCAFQIGFRADESTGDKGKILIYQIPCSVTTRYAKVRVLIFAAGRDTRGNHMRGAVQLVFSRDGTPPERATTRAASGRVLGLLSLVREHRRATRANLSKLRSGASLARTQATSFVLSTPDPPPTRSASGSPRRPESGPPPSRPSPRAGARRARHASCPAWCTAPRPACCQ